MENMSLKKTELLTKCKELGITKCSNKNKRELIELINKKTILIENESKDNLIENESKDNLTDIITLKISKQDLKKNKTKILNEINCLNTDNIINEKVSLYYGDCIIEMNKIENDSVDLILCDLPYGTTKCKWDTIINLTELWEHYKRIIKKPHGVILLFGQQPFTSMLVSSNYEWFKYNLIWKKIKQLNSYWQIIDL